MKTALLIGIIVCVLTLIGVLIHSIKNKAMNLPEIIIGVTAAILSILLACLFNGNIKDDNDTSTNNLIPSSSILTTDTTSTTEPTKNTAESVADATTGESSSSVESINNNKENVSTSQDITNTNETVPPESNPTEPELPKEPQPVPIKKLILKSSSENYNISQTEFDPRGKIYTNVIRLDSSAVNGIGYRGKLELYTERKYSTFSCSFVPEANYSTNSSAGAYIEIYKDDVLAYTSDLITYKTTAIDVNLDIQNVEYLKIKIINVNKNYPYMANADTLLCNAYVME